jgi:hypothetical protein
VVRTDCGQGATATSDASVPPKEPKREYKVGDKIRVNLYRGQIDDAIVRAVIQQVDGTKLQVDVVGLDLTALIDARQVVE